MVFPQFAIRIGPSRVEIAKADRSNPIRMLEVGQSVFDRQLGLSVRVDRRGGLRLPQRDLVRLAVYRARGREDEVEAFFPGHCLEGGQRAAHIVVVVAGRIRHRLADEEASGEMHDRRCPALAKSPAYRVEVADVSLNERSTQGGFPMSCGEIVENDDPVTGATKGLCGMTADIAGAASDEHRASRSEAGGA